MGQHEHDAAHADALGAQKEILRSPPLACKDRDIHIYYTARGRHTGTNLLLIGYTR